MDYARVIVPAAPVRRKSRHQSEMTNQLLFGEAVKLIKEKKGGWSKVRSLHDSYEGWTRSVMLEEVKEEEAKMPVLQVTTGLLNELSLEGNVLQLPMGASLPTYADKKGSIGALSYVYEGNSCQRRPEKPDDAKIRQLLFQWLNAPYLWGGRTLFGVDCSGFVQVNYKILGFDLPRDAWQQAQIGKVTDKLKEAVCGDLAFFDDKEEIVHVGVLLDSEHIIHASGKVRIDKIDKKGIINSDTGKRSHSLRVIKKLW